VKRSQGQFEVEPKQKPGAPPEFVKHEFNSFGRKATTGSSKVLFLVNWIRGQLNFYVRLADAQRRELALTARFAARQLSVKKKFLTKTEGDLDTPLPPKRRSP